MTEEKKYEVQNLVATVSFQITETLDLPLIHRVNGGKYQPEKFPGLILKFEDPKATILLFSTGKSVVTGLKKEADVRIAVNNLIEKLKTADIELAEPEIKVQNIVANGELKEPLDLNLATVKLEGTMYDPAVFPGLIYRITEPKVVFLLFSTGRFVCTGGKSLEMVDQGIEHLYEVVKNADISKKAIEASELEDEESMHFL